MLNGFVKHVKRAAYGSVRVALPCYVVFVATVPTIAMEKFGATKFYLAFLNAFWSSLDDESVSRDCFAAYVKAYVECLLFVATKPDTHDCVVS